jgi:hypothetical protein
MEDRAVTLHATIVAMADDAVVDDEDGADGNATLGQAGLRLFDCCEQETMRGLSDEGLGAS